MVEAVRGVDYAVLVTEPTPMGLHDLRLAVETVRDLGIPCGVVVNRAGQPAAELDAYCRAEQLPLLAELPFDRRIAEVYARGEIVIEALPGYSAQFQQMLSRIMAHIEIAHTAQRVRDTGHTVSDGRKA
jgi:MinD superfamily P-loop ATPase